MSSDAQQRLEKRKEVQAVQLLVKSGLFLHRELNQTCRQCGLSMNQFSVLHEIIIRGPLSQKELCRRLLFEKSNLSKIVKTLLDKGLVNVATDPIDRRLTLLIDTPEGIERWRECMQAVAQSIMHLMASLSVEEASETVNILKKLEMALAGMPDT